MLHAIYNIILAIFAFIVQALFLIICAIVAVANFIAQVFVNLYHIIQNIVNLF